MLILSRYPTQSIIIGDRHITITVLKVTGDRVDIGITAPDDVAVHREEIYEKIQKEKAEKNKEEL